MKKIPTLFKREFADHKVINITNEVTPGMEWVLEGKGTATVKFDGSCCAIINGELYKRYDAKHGKKPPEGAIPCCEPDAVTGHHPHWIKVDKSNPADKYFVAAYDSSIALEATNTLPDGTYEAIGMHFNNNPYNMHSDTLIPHGKLIVNVERTFDGIKKWLEVTDEEGLVFWKDGEPMCKIKKRDFGFEWKVKTRSENYG